MRAFKVSILIVIISTLMNLSLRASDTKDAETSSSDHIAAKVDDQFNMVASFSYAEFIRGAVDELENENAQQFFRAQLSRHKTSREDLTHLSWALLRELKKEAIKLGHTYTLPRTYLTMAKLYLSTNVLPQMPITNSGDVLSEEALVNYLIDRLEQFNLSTPIKQSYEYKWALIYHAMLNMKIIDHAADKNTAIHSFVQALKKLNEAETLGSTKFTYAVLAKLVLTYGELMNLSVEERMDKARNYLDKFYAPKQARPAKTAGDAVERREIKTPQREDFWKKIARPPYFSDKRVQAEASTLFGMATQDNRLNRGPEIARPQNPNAGLSVVERSQLMLETFDAMAQANGANPKVSQVADAIGVDPSACWRVLKNAGRIETKKISSHLPESVRKVIVRRWRERGYHLMGDKEAHYRELADEFNCSFRQVTRAVLNARSNAHEQTSKRDASPERS